MEIFGMSSLDPRWKRPIRTPYAGVDVRDGDEDSDAQKATNNYVAEARGEGPPLEKTLKTRKQLSSEWYGSRDHPRNRQRAWA